MGAAKTRRASISAAVIRANLGLLVVLPIVIILWGSEWSVGLSIDHRWLIVLAWTGMLGLRGSVRRSGSAAKSIGWVQRSIQRVDPVLAGLLIYAVLFRLPESARSLLIALLISLTLIVFIALLRVASGPLLLTLGIAFLILGVVVPRVIQARLIARVSATYELSVDHRMMPDGEGINTDGIRFRGEAIDLTDDEFVILFLGDSFTYGEGLSDAETYPHQFETIARGGRCRSVVRAVNFGWISSSPLLSLRLLREVGYKYRADLVVYNLDMTDFQDDLRYEKWLREQKHYAFDASAVMERLVLMELPWASEGMQRLKSVTDLLRGLTPRMARAC